jgi:hypothetical protein
MSSGVENLNTIGSSMQERRHILVVPPAMSTKQRCMLRRDNSDTANFERVLIVAVFHESTFTQENTEDFYIGV